jgi:hypothetical protein
MKKTILTTALIFVLMLCNAACAQGIKISALPADLSPTADDLTMTVDNPSGTAVTKKTTLAAIRTLVLQGDGSALTGLTMSQIASGSLPESRISFTNITDGNVSITKHGFAPIAPNDATKYLDGTGAWTVPSTAASGGWTDGGLTISNTTLTDKVGIGTATPTVALDVVGNITATGTVTASSFAGNASTATTATTAGALASNGANCSSGQAPLGVNASGAVEGCFTVMTGAAIDTSAEVAAILTDETGSGSLVFNTNPTFSGTVTATTFAGSGASLTGVSPAFTTSAGLAGLLSNETGTTLAVFSDSPVFSTVVTLPSAAAPTVDATGEIAVDNNLWASGRGAAVLFDGSTSTALVGVLTSDSPSNGQVPKWNTGGTITWENDSGGTITVADTQVLFADGANTPAGDSGFTYNKTTNIATADGFNTTATANPMMTFKDSDATDGDVNGQIDVQCGVVTSGSEECNLHFSNQIAGVLTKTLEIQGADGWTVFSGAGLEVDAIELATAGNIVGQKHHLKVTVPAPHDFYDNVDHEVVLWSKTDAAITVINVEVSCDADPTTELDLDLKWADAFIGMAGATLINALDTTAGVLSDSTITAGAVASGKAIYLSFGAAPDEATTQFSVDVTYTYD